MTLEDEGFYDVAEIASFLKTTRNAIYIAVHNSKGGSEIPPSVKIGKRRLWPKCDYRKWASGLTPTGLFAQTEDMKGNPETDKKGN